MPRNYANALEQGTTVITITNVLNRQGYNVPIGTVCKILFLGAVAPTGFYYDLLPTNGSTGINSCQEDKSFRMLTPMEVLAKRLTHEV